MGPNSKKAVVKVLGALTQECRALGARADKSDQLMRDVLLKLTEAIDTMNALSAQIGETVASHTRANAQIIELRREQSTLEMRLDSLLDRRGTNGAAE